MSAPKPKRWYPDQKAKLFFSESLHVAIPDELIPDGEHRSFTFNGGCFGYVGGTDERGAYVMVTKTYRPPTRKTRKPVLRFILGGKK